MFVASPRQFASCFKYMFDDGNAKSLISKSLTFCDSHKNCESTNNPPCPPPLITIPHCLSIPQAYTMLSNCFYFNFFLFLCVFASLSSIGQFREDNPSQIRKGYEVQADTNLSKILSSRLQRGLCVEDPSVRTGRCLPDYGGMRPVKPSRFPPRDRALYSWTSRGCRRSFPLEGHDSFSQEWCRPVACTGVISEVFFHCNER